MMTQADVPLAFRLVSEVCTNIISLFAKTATQKAAQTTELQMKKRKTETKKYEIKKKFKK